MLYPKSDDEVKLGDLVKVKRSMFSDEVLDGRVTFVPGIGGEDKGVRAMFCESIQVTFDNGDVMAMQLREPHEHTQYEMKLVQRDAGFIGKPIAKQKLEVMLKGIPSLETLISALNTAGILITDLTPNEKSGAIKGFNAIANFPTHKEKCMMYGSNEKIIILYIENIIPDWPVRDELCAKLSHVLGQEVKPV